MADELKAIPIQMNVKSSSQTWLLSVLLSLSVIVTDFFFVELPNELVMFSLVFLTLVFGVTILGLVYAISKL